MAVIKLAANVSDNIPGLPSSLSVPLYQLDCPDVLASIIERGATSVLGNPEVDLALDVVGANVSVKVGFVDTLHPDIAALIPSESLLEPVGVIAGSIIKNALGLPITAKAQLSFTVA